MTASIAVSARQSPIERLASAVRAEPDLALLVAVVLTIPLELTRKLLPTGVLDLARVGMIAGFVLVSTRIVRGERRLILPPRPIVLATALIVAIDALSFAIFRWPGGAKPVIALVAFIAFGFFALQTLTDTRRIRIVLLALFIAGCAEALFLLLEQAGDFYIWVRDFNEMSRKNGTFVDPNIAARMLVLAVGAGLGTQLVPASMRVRAAIAVGGAIVGLALPVTLSRTAWALLMLVLLAMALVARRPRLIALGPAAVLLGFVIGFVATPAASIRAADAVAPDVDVVVTAPSAAPAARTTTIADGLLRLAPLDQTRTYLGRAAVAMYEDAPGFGVGLGGYQPMLLGPYRHFIAGPSGDRVVSLAHTDVLRIAAEEGTIGLLGWAAFLAMVALVTLRALRRVEARPLVAAAAVGVLVVLLSSQMEGRFYTDPYLWLFLAIISAVALAPRQPSQAPE